MPKLNIIANICWFLFAITLPLRLFTNWLAFGALIAGVIKKHGFPKFNKEFLQRVMYDENF